MDDFDLIIAATAITHNLTIFTDNLNYFKGLRGSSWIIGVGSVGVMDKGIVNEVDNVPSCLPDHAPFS